MEKEMIDKLFGAAINPNPQPNKEIQLSSLIIIIGSVVLALLLYSHTKRNRLTQKEKSHST